MKVGFRTPSPKRSFSARTTGRLERTIKRSIDPTYGKKGIGYIKNPKRAVYNKVYNKVTYDFRDAVGSKHSHNDTCYRDSSKVKTPKSAVFIVVFVLGIILCVIGHFILGAALIIVSFATALCPSGKSRETSEIQKINADDDFKPFNIDVQVSHASNKDNNSFNNGDYTDNSIENSYAFANRLKNLISSRMISESDLADQIGISNEDLQKYKFSTGFPPQEILQKFEGYFNVSFRYLCVYRETMLYSYDGRRLMYSRAFNYPHKARFDNNGKCVLLDFCEDKKHEVLYHLDNNGNVLGKIDGFPQTRIEYLKLSANGNYALLISETLKVFFVDMTNHAKLWSKSIRINSYNIKDITDNELVFRYTKGDKPICFSLDYNGDPYDFTALALYFYDKKPPIRYHIDDYLLIMTAMLPKFGEYEKELLGIVDFMSRSTSVKYIPAGRLSNIHKEIGKYYFGKQDYEHAKAHFQKALSLNPKAGVKSFMNKIDKLT